MTLNDIFDNQPEDRSPAPSAEPWWNDASKAGGVFATWSLVIVFTILSGLAVIFLLWFGGKILG